MAQINPNFSRGFFCGSADLAQIPKLAAAAAS